MDFCTKCKTKVSTKQFALQCDVCNQWQHQKCDSGVSGKQYRKLRDLKVHFSYNCNNCKEVQVPREVCQSEERSSSPVHPSPSKRTKKNQTQPPTSSCSKERSSSPARPSPSKRTKKNQTQPPTLSLKDSEIEDISTVDESIPSSYDTAVNILIKEKVLK